MESTSGTPHLLTDVRFSVTRKGYDPDEVDNFLERVSAAVAQLQEKLRQATADAEAADGRAAEATRQQTLLQARVDKLESDLGAAGPAAAPVRPPEEDAAEVSKVLVLAQRTADAAVAEARATASQTVADAEAEAGRILAKARTEADETASRQREALAAEVRSLEDSRAKLAGDIAALDRYLDDQRSSLTGALDRIRAVLDDPAALRLGSVPATSSVEVPNAAATAPAGASASPAPAAPAAAPAPPETETEPESEPEATPEPQPTPVALADEEPGADDDAPSEAGTDRPSAPEGAPSGSLFSRDSDVAPADPPTSPVAVFDAEAEEAEEQFLGRDDEEADAAMRRFFEADFDDDQRFGR